MAFRNRRVLSADDPEYFGEIYTPAPDGDAFRDHRTREKGYAMIAVILHVIIGFLPAMGLNVAWTAACYAAAMILAILIALRAYQAPSEAVPLSREQYRRYVTGFRVLVNVQRLLIMLSVILDVIFNFAYQLGVSIWFILQIALFLLEALSLQFLFRQQRNVTWEAGTK